MQVLSTERLVLRRLTPDDAPFMLRLLNEPSWLRFIGDRGVRTLEEARAYILNGPMAMYERVGFGLYLVELKPDGTAIGICGLLKRDALDDVDIGYALLPEFWSQGYAYEAAAAVVEYARGTIGLTRIVAIMSPGNDASAKVLRKIGLTFERMVRLSDDAKELELYGSV